LELIERGVIRAEHVVTHRFPLEQVAQAYRTAAQDRSAIKTLVTFPALQADSGSPKRKEATP
jgi:threonine dehydrogenase-like Zn-dependent dehydrogenase